MKPPIPILIMCIVAIAATACLHPSGTEDEMIECNLTLVGDCTRVLSYDEIRAIPSCEGRGGFFTTVGIVNGPFECRGVSLEELCDLVGGINATDTVWIRASDGYLMVFNRDQVRGDFITYNPVTMREVPHIEPEVMLMYEQDGGLLSMDTGGPLRVAIVSRGELLTEGHYWVQWVDTIEIMK
ncbi:MAG: molybdopterin-binding oxidoreductase [Methanosarcinales archaeon]|nr:MAG: molybdopterin-binding oxidoreductase [Methanosarcinales archaeon]